MTREERYNDIMDRLAYDEMTSEESEFCMEYEADVYLPKIIKVRQEGVDDVKISAYLMDLYDEYLVFDDVYIADRAEISDEDYASGREYYQYEMSEPNPLMD